MTETTRIVPATSDAALESVRGLCNHFLAWLRTRYDTVDDYYPQPQWEQLLADLPIIHAAPAGGIWIAECDGQAAGVVMLRPWDEPDTCEMKRLVVRDSARGRGLGRMLAMHAVTQALGRGYARMVFDTGVHHTEAMDLYKTMGFRVRPPYYDCPEALRDQLVFFEGDLAEIAARRADDRRTGAGRA